jgi:hypothetical protein
MKNKAHSKTIIMATVKGDQELKIKSKSHIEIFKAIEGIQERFAGVVIYRTVWSVDNTGARISGLAPFQEHILVINLYKAEMTNLELVAQGLMKESTHRAV